MSKYQQRRMAGLCVQCGEQAEAGKSRCRKHLDSLAASNRKFYHEGGGKERQYLKQQEIRDLLASLKTACVHCGITHPAVLEFHHRNPAEKEFVLAFAHRMKPTLARLMDEVAKCDIICANCHRIHHWEERQRGK